MRIAKKDHRERKSLVVYSDDSGDPLLIVSRNDTVYLGDLDKGVQEGVS